MTKIKPIKRREFFNKRIKMGRSTISTSVQLFASLTNDALAQGDEGLFSKMAVGFVQKFKECWQSGDATFFRELAHCIEHRTETLTQRRRWLRGQLFRSGDPDRQTRFLTGEEILAEYHEEHDDPDMKYDLRRLRDDMKAIGAVFRNGRQRKRQIGR
jgi:hypothetical protein